MAAARAGVRPCAVSGSCLCPFSPRSYLCFESSKSGSSKRNKVIKLVDITDIQKVSMGPPVLCYPFRIPEERGHRATKLMGFSWMSDMFTVRE